MKSTRKIENKVADLITDFAGSMLFVYLHIIWFVAWMLTGLFGRDPFPFNLLTMAVSLEAIFLSTFILISQNKAEELDKRNNQKFQEEILSDERLDQKNEILIQDLLGRIDVEHLSPMKKQLAELHQEFFHKDTLTKKIIARKFNPYKESK